MHMTRGLIATTLWLVSGCVPAPTSPARAMLADCTEISRRDGERAGKVCFIAALAECEPAILLRESSRRHLEGVLWERETAWIERKASQGCTVVIDRESSEDGVTWLVKTRYHDCRSVGIALPGFAGWPFTILPMDCEAKDL